ncbi:elongation factor EF-2 [Candidatus Undinarchaeota archaeon]
MGRREQMIKDAQAMTRDPEHIRNIGIVAHIDHGKTTLSDSLIAGAGLMAEGLAGRQLVMDSYDLEQQRGITIFSGAASMVHTLSDQKYLVNLSDTPGHVDFGAEVIRSMRAVDGVIVVACAVEGVMPQTETVIRQALDERVRPILFINKVDRLLNELKLTPDELQARFMKTIGEVNKLIKSMAPDELKEKWQVNVNDGSVAFGSAYHTWALNVPVMKEQGITFKDIIDTYAEHGTDLEKAAEEISKKAPSYRVLLDMVVKHLPNPIEAQKYRIPKIWDGDPESELGKSLVNCDADGPFAFMVTKMIVDPQAGEIATGRLFSGSISPGQDVRYVTGKGNGRAQQISMMIANERYNVESVAAGNIVAISGLKNAISGETLCDVDLEMEPFESIHLAEPVISKAVEAKETKDLPKLIQVLKDLAKEDPSIKVQINDETGEHIMSGMGELHLEIVEHRIIKDRGVPIITSQPIIVYRENIAGAAGPIEGKSPNKHNRFLIEVSPLEESLVKALEDGDLDPTKVKGKDLIAALQEYGMEKDEAKKVKAIHGYNMLVDASKGVQNLFETMELVIQAFEEAMDSGPLAKEKVARVKVRLTDASLHEDAIHRGPGQIIPATKDAIYQAMLQAKPGMIEPKQIIHIRVPHDFMGSITRELQSRRGQIINMDQEGDLTIVEAKAPVAEMLGFASAIRSAAEGRVLWSTENAGFEQLPRELQDGIVTKIRQRKGIGG